MRMPRGYRDLMGRSDFRRLILWDYRLRGRKANGGSVDGLAVASVGCGWFVPPRLINRTNPDLVMSYRRKLVTAGIGKAAYRGGA